VFVNFTRQGPTLREWLDPVWDAWGSTAGVPARGDVGEGLPVQLEGGAGELLESYHIPEVHPYTFKEFPAEENAWHELTDRFSSFRTVPPREFATRRRTGWCGGWAVPVSNEYWHQVLHPHATGSSLDSFDDAVRVPDGRPVPLPVHLFTSAGCGRPAGVVAVRS
jgi:hypothetical protein